MILTVTLNPTVDRALEVEQIALGDTNRVVRSQSEPGGKGINVSRALRVLEIESLALGFVSGGLGRFVEHAVNELGIPDDFIHTPGQTRTNTIVIDHSAKIHTTFSERGPETDQHYFEELLRRLRRHLQPNDWVVVSGSLPPGIPTDAYARIIGRVRELGGQAVLDADGEILAAGLAAGPRLIKPNQNELERLVGRSLSDDAAILAAVQEVRGRGVPIVVASLGAAGSIAADETGAWRARSPQITVNSAVGSGDSLVAGLVAGLARGDSLAEALRLGTACGAATALTSGTELCYREDIERLLPAVVIEPIEGRAT